MPDDISIQVSGSIGTLSGSIGLKIDPFKPVGNQTPPATVIPWLRFGALRGADVYSANSFLVLG